MRLALIAKTGEMGYPSALTARTWGFYDALFRGKPFRFPRRYGSYVMENVLFKISFPAEFHAQTAVEAAVLLHHEVKDRLSDIKKIEIVTHESAIRIIDKKGPLNNPADRDHCIQYMVAIGLIKGNLTAADYEDDVARDLRIDALRAKMLCVESKQYSRDYLNPKKRSIANRGGRISDRSPPPPPRRHPLARSEIPEEPRPPFSERAARGHPLAVPGSESPGGHPGPRIHRHVRNLKDTIRCTAVASCI